MSRVCSEDCPIARKADGKARMLGGMSEAMSLSMLLRDSQVVCNAIQRRISEIEAAIAVARSEYFKACAELDGPARRHNRKRKKP